MLQTAAPPENLEGLVAGSQDFVERLPMLHTVLQKTASNWTEQIGSISATVPDAALLGVEGAPAETVIAAMESRSVACVLEASKWNGRLIACADHAFVCAGVEMLLGGDGSEPPSPPDRPLSRIDFKLTQLLFEQFASALEMAFEDVAPTPFVVGAAAPRANFEVLGRLSVPLVAARFQLSALGLAGELTLILSQSVLSPMRNELSRAAPPEDIMPDPAWSQKIHSEITRTNVELVAVLDEQTLSLAEIADFSVGKTLKLRATPEGPVSIECNGERLINCQIGKSNGVYAARVHDFVDQEKEFMEDILAS